MKKAHGVGKSGRNDFHKYDYASDFDVLSLVQPAMVENGLALAMWPERIEGPDQDGNMAVRFLMQWQHESGAVAEPIPWYGVAQDRSSKGAMGDKWFNKAATAAEKYFLLKQLHIPAGKDADPDSQSPNETAPPGSHAGAAQEANAKQAASKSNSRAYQLVDASGEVAHEFKGQGAADQVLATLEGYADSEPSIVHANRALLERAAGSKQKAFAERAQAILDKVDQPAEAAE